MKSSSAIKRETTLKNKAVLLGVSGGVAAYKSVELVRRLKAEGASVSVVMTESAKQFITPLSLEVASQNRVYTSLFEEPLAHIRLPADADAMIIAPATANNIAKYAHGLADDLLSTCLLSFSGTVIIAPSMNWRMYENPIVQRNLKELTASGVIQVGPEQGSLACGEEGVGRMAEVNDIVETVKTALSSRKDLAGQKIVVTAGPTREYLDPVRFISNRSSGKMGYAIAKAARNRGADVTLVSGPSALSRPGGMKFLQVETSREMLDAVMQESRDASALIMAAAVADFTPLETAPFKTDKSIALSLQLRLTDDIISQVTEKKKKPFVIGFAAETGPDTTRAVLKMKQKKMDMIAFNDVSEPGAGFETDTNRVTIIDSKGAISLDLMSKDAVADAIFDRMLEIKA